MAYPPRVGDFRIGKTLGEGSFGKVKLGVDSRGKKAAIKIIDKGKIADAKTWERTMREFAVLKIVQHPNVVKQYDVIEHGDRIFVVLELVEGGELFDYIIAQQRVQEPKARIIFAEIVDGVHHLHRLNIIHRDLKPENILLDRNKSVKIIDFGLCNTMKIDNGLSSRCGSPYYVAPEMIAGRGYGTSVDIWSMGIILYALLSGDVPFSDTNLTALLDKIIAGKYSMPRFLSDEAKDLIRKMLVTDPSRRISIDDIRAHPWLNMKPLPPLSIDPKLASMSLETGILDQMRGLGFDEALVTENLKKGVANGITNVYYTILKLRHGLGDESKNEEDLNVHDLEDVALVGGTPRPASGRRTSSAAAGNGGGGVLPNIQKRPGTPSGDAKARRNR